MHAGKQGLPWKAPVAQLKPVQVELTTWNWPRFYTTFSKDNSDILSILFPPIQRFNSSSTPGESGTICKSLRETSW